MTKVEPERLELIKESIIAGYEAGIIQNLDDFDRFFLTVWEKYGINDGQRRGAVLRSIKSTSPVIAALIKKAAEANLPITLDSPSTDLPVSLKVKYIFRRAGLLCVGDIINLLREEGKDGLLYLPKVGDKFAQEIYDALKWARIEIPQEQKSFRQRSASDSEPYSDKSDKNECLYSEKAFEEKAGPGARVISLEPGENFKTEFFLTGDATNKGINIDFGKKRLIIKARRLVFEAIG